MFQANENNRDFIGKGHIDWVNVCAALADAAPDVPITLEPFRRNEHRLGVSLAHWRAPEENEDAALAASAALLRKYLADARKGR